jgi:hypothetical protein
MKARKLTTLALTGALALGGLGIGSMADLPIPGMSATQADAAGDIGEVITANSGVNFNTLNAIGTWSDIEVDPVSTWFDGAPRFIIKNSVGTVVKTGSMNAVTGADTQSGTFVWQTGTTNISLAGLPKNNNHYRIEFTWQANNGVINSAMFPNLTKAFTYNADGTVTNIRP